MVAFGMVGPGCMEMNKKTGGGATPINDKRSPINTPSAEKKPEACSHFGFAWWGMPPEVISDISILTSIW